MITWIQEHELDVFSSYSYQCHTTTSMNPRSIIFTPQACSARVQVRFFNAINDLSQQYQH